MMSAKIATRVIMVVAVLGLTATFTLFVGVQTEKHAELPVPVGVDVIQKDASFLKATFRPTLEDAPILHASTSNSSFSLRHHNADLSSTKPFIISIDSETIHEVEHVNILQVMEHTFILLESANGRVVRLQVPAGTEWRSFADKTTIKMMYEEDARILEEVQAANRAFALSWRDMLDRHSSSLKATIDMMQTMGIVHNITGAEFPHTLELWALTLRLSKALNYDPYNSRTTEYSNPHNTTHRRTQSSCAQGTCSATQRCQSPPSNRCLGMCGPGCSCWHWICHNCCYNYFCYKHDQCCSGRGDMTQGTCWHVIYKLNSRGGLSASQCKSAYSYSCRALWGDGSGGGS